MATKKIIKKTASAAPKAATKATVKAVDKANITNVEDFYGLVRDQYNATNEKKITKDEVNKVMTAFSEAFGKFATNSDADKTTCILPGIGRFSVFVQKERDGVNPKTGEKIKIAAKKRVSFKTFPRFSDVINGK